MIFDLNNEEPHDSLVLPHHYYCKILVGGHTLPHDKYF